PYTTLFRSVGHSRLVCGDRLRRVRGLRNAPGTGAPSCSPYPGGPVPLAGSGPGIGPDDLSNSTRHRDVVPGRVPGVSPPLACALSCEAMGRLTATAVVRVAKRPKWARARRCARRRCVTRVTPGARRGSGSAVGAVSAGRDPRRHREVEYDIAHRRDVRTGPEYMARDIDEGVPEGGARDPPGIVDRGALLTHSRHEHRPMEFVEPGGVVDSGADDHPEGARRRRVVAPVDRRVAACDLVDHRLRDGRSPGLRPLQRT